MRLIFFAVIVVVVIVVVFPLQGGVGVGLKHHSFSKIKIPDQKQIDSILLTLTNFKQIVSNPEKYHLQIIYTDIKRDVNNQPTFRTYTYRTSENDYFYCASLVKLPTAALALEKINTLSKLGITKDTRVIFDSISNCQKKIWTDTSSQDKKATIANYIKRMLLISDNEAFNRTLDFVTLQYLNNRLREMGYDNARIYHNFETDCSDKSISRPLSFFDENEKQIFKQESAKYTSSLQHPLGKVWRGKAYLNSKNKMIKTPKDFSNYNYLTLNQIHDILKTVHFPNSVEEDKRFKLNDEDYSFLKSYLLKTPSQVDFPRYSNKKEFPENLKKYILFGDGTFPQSQQIQDYNIVGQSYGDLSDCAYIVDKKNKVEFILAVAIYCNEDEIINDGKYDYKTVGLPFMSELGKAFYHRNL